MQNSPNSTDISTASTNTSEQSESSNPIASLTRELATVTIPSTSSHAARPSLHRLNAANHRELTMLTPTSSTSEVLYHYPSQDQIEWIRREQLRLQQEHEATRLRQRLADQRSGDGRRRLSHGMQGGQHRSSHRQEQQQQQQQTQQQQQKHQVYLIDCATCGAFLSDRGMKAVLLLKPHITLYSTDVIPSNCGPLYPAAPAGRLPSSRSPNVERTCDCLTQTLGCYGCGAQVGYHIASPCAKCTASVTDVQRGSNGHRTVLHCSEITVRERRYVPGEPAVMCAPVPTPASVVRSSPRHSLSAALQQSTHARNQRLMAPRFEQEYGAFPRNVQVVHIDPEGNDHYRVPRRDFHALPSFHRHGYDGSRREPFGSWRNADFPDGDYDEDDDLDLSDKTIDYMQQQQERLMDYALSAATHQNYFNQQQQQHQQRGQGDSDRRASKARAQARYIERGGLVYWSDLVPGGERAEPFDTELALDMPVAGR